MQYRPEDRVKVQLKVNKSLLCCPGSPCDYYVAVTGSGLQLGNNDPNIAPRCKQLGRNLWMKEIWPKKHSDIKFRFLVVKRSNNVIVDIENTGPRNLSIESKPVIVDVKFNKPRISAKENDEITSCDREPQYSRRCFSNVVSNKANLQAHQNVRNQSKYSLQQHSQTKDSIPRAKFMPYVKRNVNNESWDRFAEREKMVTKGKPKLNGQPKAALASNDTPPTEAVIACKTESASLAAVKDCLLITTVRPSKIGPVTTKVAKTELMTTELANNILLSSKASNTQLMATHTTSRNKAMTTTTTSHTGLIATAIKRDTTVRSTVTISNTELELMTSAITRDFPLAMAVMASNTELMVTKTVRSTEAVTTEMANDIPLMKTPTASNTNLTAAVITNNTKLMTTETTNSTGAMATEDTALMTTAISTKRIDNKDINLPELIQERKNTEAIVHQNYCTKKEPRRIGVESMSPKWQPSTRAFLLAAAGVVAASCVGHYAFIRK